MAVTTDLERLRENGWVNRVRLGEMERGRKREKVLKGFPLLLRTFFAKHC